MNQNNILIVTGGHVDIQFLKDYYRNNEELCVVGVDKGLDALNAAGITPNMVIGDFDSACDSIRTMYIDSPDAIVLNPEKDFSDTHAAVLEAMKYTPDKIVIIGGTGSRLDHTFGTISLLKICLEQGIDAEILDPNNRIRMINKELRIEKENQYGKYVSLIPFSDIVEGVSLNGFKYEVDSIDFYKADTLGVSNEICKEECLITIKNGYMLVFETKD